MNEFIASSVANLPTTFNSNLHNYQNGHKAEKGNWQSKYRPNNTTASIIGQF